jgi:hypothetical protein
MRAEPLHRRRDWRHPERSVADAELRHDVLPLAYQMDDRRPEGGFVERDCFARRF